MIDLKNNAETNASIARLLREALGILANDYLIASESASSKFALENMPVLLYKLEAFRQQTAETSVTNLLFVTLRAERPASDLQPAIDAIYTFFAQGSCHKTQGTPVYASVVTRIGAVNEEAQRDQNLNSYQIVLVLVTHL